MMPWFYKAISSTLKIEAESVLEISGTFTPLRDCVPEKILQHVFVPICDTNILSQIQSTHHNKQQNYNRDKTTHIQSEISLYAPVSTHF